MPKHKTYQQNFIAGIRHLMAMEDLSEIKAVASHLGVAYMTLYKIMDGSRNPTVEQCILLCEKAGYSANWLFLNKGEMYLGRQATLESIQKSVKELQAELLPEKNLAEKQGLTKSLTVKSDR